MIEDIKRIAREHDRRVEELRADDAAPADDGGEVKWTQVVQSMARRQASSTGGWMDQGDLVQEALLRIIEEEGGVLEKIWAARQGIRDPLRRSGREPSADLSVEIAAGLNPSGEMTPPPPVDDDRAGPLERRVRDAYDNPKRGDEAWAAQSGTGWAITEEQAAEDEEELSASTAGRENTPSYMEDEYRTDRGMVELVVEDFPEIVVDFLSAPERKWQLVESAAARALVVALAAYDLSPAEQGIFANELAREVVDAMPEGASDKDKAIRYGCTRIGVADEMGDLIDDEDVWPYIYPEGRADTRPLYDPPATEKELKWFVEKYVRASKPPEDATYEGGVYEGWRYWDTEVARKAHAWAALHGGSYRGDANAASGRAFWGQDRDTISEYMARHHQALDDAGLKEIVITNDDLEDLPEDKRAYARALRYKVVPQDVTPVMSLHRGGVTDVDGRRHSFTGGLPGGLAVPREHANGLGAALAKTDAPDFIGIMAV